MLARLSLDESSPFENCVIVLNRIFIAENFIKVSPAATGKIPAKFKSFPICFIFFSLHLFLTLTLVPIHLIYCLFLSLCRLLDGKLLTPLSAPASRVNNS